MGKEGKGVDWFRAYPLCFCALRVFCFLTFGAYSPPLFFGFCFCFFLLVTKHKRFGVRVRWYWLPARRTFGMGMV